MNPRPLPVAAMVPVPAMALVLMLVLVLGACAPALNWRETRPADSGATLLLPCRASGTERAVTVAGQTLRLALHACGAGGQTWGLAFADVADPARVSAVLDALRSAAGHNIAATAPGEARPLVIAGATPNSASGRSRLAGRLPTGEAVQMEVAVFSRGSKVFQATVLGAQVAAEPAETFFMSIRFAP